MKNRKLFIIVIILVVLTVLLAVTYLSGREQIAENTVLLTVGGKNQTVSLDNLSYQSISGVRVNGKGEEIPVSGQGVSLSDLLAQCGVTKYETVTVVSDDSYSAQVHADEAENANFLLEEGTLRLIVFGDSNSKRSVSNIKQITIE